MIENTFLGLHPYTEADAYRFKGRTKESQELFRLIEHNDYTVCYAESGEGKTSLLNAGVFPLLRQNMYFPISIMFTDDDYSRTPDSFDVIIDRCIRDSITAYNEKNKSIDVEYKLCSTDFQGLNCQVDLQQELSRHSWWKLRNYKPQAMGLTFTPVFVFDQFEEVFNMPQTAAWTKGFFDWLETITTDSCPDKIVEFIREAIGKDGTFPAIKENKDFKAVFSLRKEYIGELDYWGMQQTFIPALKNNRYCLRPLTYKSAMQIMSQHVLFSDKIIEKVLYHLVSRYNKEPEKIIEQQLPVLPALLISVICESWSRNLKCFKEEQIDVSIDGIVEEYYNRTISDIVNKLKKNKYNERLCQRDLKNIFLHLVDNNGRRVRCKTNSPKLAIINFDERYKKLIVESRLVKITKIEGEDYVEVIHDALCPVIQRNNAMMMEKEIESKYFLLSALPYLLIALLIANFFPDCMSCSLAAAVERGKGLVDLTMLENRWLSMVLPIILSIPIPNYFLRLFTFRGETKKLEFVFVSIVVLGIEALAYISLGKPVTGGVCVVLSLLTVILMLLNVKSPIKNVIVYEDRYRVHYFFIGLLLLECYLILIVGFRNVTSYVGIYGLLGLETLFCSLTNTRFKNWSESILLLVSLYLAILYHKYPFNLTLFLSLLCLVLVILSKRRVLEAKVLIVFAIVFICIFLVVGIRYAAILAPLLLYPYLFMRKAKTNRKKVNIATVLAVVFALSAFSFLELGYVPTLRLDGFKVKIIHPFSAVILEDENDSIIIRKWYGNESKINIPLKSNMNPTVSPINIAIRDLHRQTPNQVVESIKLAVEQSVKWTKYPVMRIPQVDYSYFGLGNYIYPLRREIGESYGIVYRPAFFDTIEKYRKKQSGRYYQQDADVWNDEEQVDYLLKVSTAKLYHKIMCDWPQGKIGIDEEFEDISHVCFIRLNRYKDEIINRSGDWDNGRKNVIERFSDMDMQLFLKYADIQLLNSAIRDLQETENVGGAMELLHILTLVVFGSTDAYADVGVSLNVLSPSTTMTIMGKFNDLSDYLGMHYVLHDMMTQVKLPLGEQVYSDKWAKALFECCSDIVGAYIGEFKEGIKSMSGIEENADRTIAIDRLRRKMDLSNYLVFFIEEANMAKELCRDDSFWVEQYDEFNKTVSSELEYSYMHMVSNQWETIEH